jgi:hypothetical protein
MDEKQKRLGTATALARPGAKPASAVPPPPALPRIASAPASPKPPRRLSKAELQRLRARSCDGVSDQGEEQEAQVFRLDARTSVAHIPVACWSGAYNISALLLVANDAGPWRNAPFDRPLAQGGEDTESGIVYNGEWDPKTRRLGTYMKGRGIGDCGTTQTHAWDGSRFRLVEQAEMGECRGSMDYIVTWRAQVVAR